MLPSLRRCGKVFLYFLRPFCNSCFETNPFFLASNALQARSASVASPVNSSNEIALSWSRSFSLCNVFASSLLRFIPRSFKKELCITLYAHVFIKTVASLVVVPVVPRNHSIFHIVRRNHSIFLYF